MNNPSGQTAFLRRYSRIGMGALLVCLSLLLAACPGPDSKPAPGVASAIGCDQAAVLNKDGVVVLPPEATEVDSTTSLVEEDNGLLSDLYPQMDTSTSEFTMSLPCEPSIGGTLPAEMPDTPDEIASEDFLKTVEEDLTHGINEDLAANPLPPPTLLAPFTVGGCFLLAPGSDVRKPEPCNSPAFLDSSQPFEGRDIIYVHGLATDQIKDKIANPPSAMGANHPSNARWPQDAGEFLNAGGYYRTYAQNYWADHIVEHLTMGWEWTPATTAPVYVPKHNRYMLVAWSSNQTMEYAMNTMLRQIQLAISNNTNVVTPPGYPARKIRPFRANGCIVITHSTGSPITSAAMSLAQLGFYGDGGKQIPQYIAAHVSFNGAISGSRLATIGMVLGLGVGTPTSIASNALCNVFDWLVGTQNSCDADTTFIASSILRDLIPGVMQDSWGGVINASPVPTVTFAGGHPVGGYFVTGPLLPGVDDGVVTMNSACGNPNPVFPLILPPSGVLVSSALKAFDFTEYGGRLQRNTQVYRAQKNLKTLPIPLYMAATCNPYLSPTGMVMPVLFDWGNLPFSMRNRFDNHYSFVQGLDEHSYNGGSSNSNPWPSKGGSPAGSSRHYQFFGTDNIEESSAVTNNGIYSRMIDGNGTRLAKPVGEHEVVRGRKLTFRMPFDIGGCKKKGPANWRCQVWVWKRTYYLLDKWDAKQSSHYAYEFVGRR